MVNDALENAQFVAQHVDFSRQAETVVRDMARAQQGGQPGLDISLLVQQAADGRVDVEIQIRGWASHCSRVCLPVLLPLLFLLVLMLFARLLFAVNTAGLVSFFRLRYPQAVGIQASETYRQHRICRVHGLRPRQGS